jgi:HAD superfamily hydrolase (TIGR01549 family)
MKRGDEIKAIFFDLDGTLLPLDQSYFIKHYFKRLAAYAMTLGIDPEKLIDSTIAGSEAMIHNDGSRTNREVFWNTFFDTYGEVIEDIEQKLDNFYSNGYKTLKELTGENSHALDIIKAAHANGRKVVLATNPLFPMKAQLERLSWVGLSEEDFDIVTSYENSNYCKPNPEYYRDICRRIGVKPEECIMLGNDESDDMKGASLAGMECFLITDHRIMADNFMWTGERGSFEQALRMIERI